MEKFYKTSVVANLLGVSNRTIQRMIKDGKIIPAKITHSGRGLFTADQIVQLQTAKSSLTFMDSREKEQKNAQNATNATLKNATQNTQNATSEENAEFKQKKHNYDEWITEVYENERHNRHV